MPRVSLIMPVYNLGRFLDEAVDSAMAQTFGDFELIIIDDGSTDAATIALLDGYSRPRTQVVRTEHRGVVAARNLGIARARGEYLSFFDADDRMGPRFLERTVAALDTDSGLSFASTWVRLFGEEDWDWKADACDLVTLLHDCSVATAALVRRAAVMEVGGFDPDMEHGHEDWDLWLSLVERGHRGAILPEVLFHYRRRSHSRSMVADRGAAYLELYRDRIVKHEASYRQHLFEVLWIKEHTIGLQLREIENTRRLTRIREAELAAAQTRLAQSQRELAGVLEALLGRAHDEIHALRDSRSWRLTAPLRGVLGWGAKRKRR